MYTRQNAVTPLWARDHGRGSRSKHGEQNYTNSPLLSRSPENRAACLSKRAPEVTLRLRFPGGEGNGFTPTCPQPLLPGTPGPRRPREQLPASAVPPAPRSLGSPGRQLPRRPPLHHANLRARPRSCPPAPRPGLPPPRACRPPRRRAGEGAPAAELMALRGAGPRRRRWAVLREELGAPPLGGDRVLRIRGARREEGRAGF
ncbi:atherin-like [Ailuropoda melanoleuca]|uniref:atherin-like n=1 Tax=Ailuropoda melanoleuca TaxID=9646 RepID=UPI00149417BA|nr:atherin-like [Ailuropoda melanoleuca]